jgi:hypothetical protein
MCPFSSHRLPKEILIVVGFPQAEMGWHGNIFNVHSTSEVDFTPIIRQGNLFLMIITNFMEHSPS